MESPVVVSPTRSEISKVTLAATIGTMIEYYDYFIGSFAAGLVWPAVFFPSSNPVAASALSISAFGSVFLTKPIGAYVFGHLGDKTGRKQTLILTLIAMGIGMLGIALTPSFATIGVLAPISIVAFRVIFGFGTGGEFGGAATWVSEFAAKSKWRSFWTSWAQTPVPIGLVLASFTFSFLSASLARPVFMDWGWRVPFVLGAVIAVVGLVIRYRLEDAPVFKQLKSSGGLEKTPANQVLKKHWGRILLLALSWTYMSALVSGLIAPYSIQYLTANHVSQTFASLSVTYGAIVAIFTIMAGAILGDVIGRKPVIAIGALLSMILVYPYFMLLHTLNHLEIILAQILLLGAILFGTGVVSALFTEQFQTSLRYSGSGLAYQIGALFTGILVTFVIPAIIVGAHGPVNAVTPMMELGVGVAAVSLIAISVVKEGKKGTLMT